MKRLIPLILLCTLIISGCSAGKDFTYEPPQESPPGPGLFSGEDGVFTIYGEDSMKKTDEKPAAKQEEETEQSK